MKSHSKQILSNLDRANFKSLRKHINHCLEQTYGSRLKSGKLNKLMANILEFNSVSEMDYHFSDRHYHGHRLEPWHHFLIRKLNEEFKINLKNIPSSRSSDEYGNDVTLITSLCTLETNTDYFHVFLYISCRQDSEDSDIVFNNHVFISAQESYLSYSHEVWKKVHFNYKDYKLILPHEENPILLASIRHRYKKERMISSAFFEALSLEENKNKSGNILESINNLIDSKIEELTVLNNEQLNLIKNAGRKISLKKAAKKAIEIINNEKLEWERLRPINISSRYINGCISEQYNTDKWCFSDLYAAKKLILDSFHESIEKYKIIDGISKFNDKFQ